MEDLDRLDQFLSGLSSANAIEETDAAQAYQRLKGGQRLRLLASLSTAELKDVFSYTFGKAYLWNSLHGSEFGVGDWLSYQTVRMVADPQRSITSPRGQSPLSCRCRRSSSSANFTPCAWAARLGTPRGSTA